MLLVALVLLIALVVAVGGGGDASYMAISHLLSVPKLTAKQQEATKKQQETNK